MMMKLRLIAVLRIKKPRQKGRSGRQRLGMRRVMRKAERGGGCGRRMAQADTYTQARTRWPHPVAQRSPGQQNFQQCRLNDFHLQPTWQPRTVNNNPHQSIRETQKHGPQQKSRTLLTTLSLKEALSGARLTNTARCPIRFVFNFLLTQLIHKSIRIRLCRKRGTAPSGGATRFIQLHISTSEGKRAAADL